MPGSNWFAQMASKTMPMVIAEFYGWLDYPEYFFFWTYDGANNSVFDTANYVNPDLDKVIDVARFTRDPEVYKTSLNKMVDIVMTDVPAHSAVHALRRLRDAEECARASNTGFTPIRTSASSTRSEQPSEGARIERPLPAARTNVVDNTLGAFVPGEIIHRAPRGAGRCPA